MSEDSWTNAHIGLSGRLLYKTQQRAIVLDRNAARNWWIDTSLTVLTGIIAVAISLETFVLLNPRAHELLGGFGGLTITSLLIINRTYTFASAHKDAARDRAKCLFIVGLLSLQLSLSPKDRQNAYSFLRNVIALASEVDIVAPSLELDTAV